MRHAGPRPAEPVDDPYLPFLGWSIEQYMVLYEPEGYEQCRREDEEDRQQEDPAE